MSRVNYYQSAFNSQSWIFILPKFMHFGDSRRPFVIDNRLGKLGDVVAISNLTLSMMHLKICKKLQQQLIFVSPVTDGNLVAGDAEKSLQSS